MDVALTCNAVDNAKGGYMAHAEPITPNGTGSRTFGTDERGTIFQNTDATTAFGLQSDLVTGGTIGPVQ
jgi:hypothetical protein